MYQRLFLLLGILMLATPAPAAVVVYDQLTTIDTLAGSACGGEADSNPELDDIWVDWVADVDVAAGAQKSSDCGSAEFSGDFELAFESQAMAGELVARSTLDNLGGGTAATHGVVLIRATTPTEWSLTATCSRSETGDSDNGLFQVQFADQAMGDTDGFSMNWSGSLAEGETVVLSLTAVSSRQVLWVDGIPILMDGSTDRTITFRLEFQDQVTPTLPTSLTQLKTRY